MRSASLIWSATETPPRAPWPASGLGPPRSLAAASVGAVLEDCRDVGGDPDLSVDGSGQVGLGAISHAMVAGFVAADDDQDRRLLKREPPGDDTTVVARCPAGGPQRPDPQRRYSADRSENVSPPGARCGGILLLIIGLTSNACLGDDGSTSATKEWS
ncbi:hypothetical protein AB0F52_14875 [Amycolatopsis sp. NPDC024027]|uniref:hypothetical protein n=1 Tax=Amycolatopsis sp. NPDC024027 TaxID=3154327 RepID=UPI0033F702E8